ncbi:MAG: type II toxin-antitoxin system RelE family toxin [Solirubrobacteraceae bacterium]
MTEEPWRLVVAPGAVRALDRLPGKHAAAVLEALQAIAENPRRLGKPLQAELAGLWSARRGPYRILYALDGERRRVDVVRIGHRADVYRR